MRHSRQQSEERAALEEQFAARVRSQKQLSDAPRLAQAVAAALDDGRAEQDPFTEDGTGDDAFALTGRLIRAIDAICPHAAQLLSFLLCESQELVQSKLRSEAERSSRSKRVASPAATRSPWPSSSSDEGDSSSDEGDGRGDSQDESTSDPQALMSPRSPSMANRRRFRTTLRSRRIPPTRVSDSERVTAKSAYTPFSPPLGRRC